MRVSLGLENPLYFVVAVFCVDFLRHHRVVTVAQPR